MTEMDKYAIKVCLPDGRTGYLSRKEDKAIIVCDRDEAEKEARLYRVLFPGHTVTIIAEREAHYSLSSEEVSPLAI